MFDYIIVGAGSAGVIHGGEVLMTGGALSQVLLRFASQFVGRFRGGMGHTNILTLTFFSGISGSSAANGATIAAGSSRTSPATPTADVSWPRDVSIAAAGPRSAYEVSVELFGTSLDASGRRFALAETLAHLERLVQEDRAVRAGDDRDVSYTAA